MLKNLKKTYRFIILQYVIYLSDQKSSLLINEARDNLMQINKYTRLLLRIEQSESLSDLRNLIVSLQPLSQELYGRFWSIYKDGLKDTMQLSEHLEIAAAISREQILDYKETHPESDEDKEKILKL